MDKLIYKNKFTKFIVALIIAFNLISFVPNKVEAKDDGVGGKLAEPVADLMLIIGDGALSIVHSFVMGQEDDVIFVNPNENIIAKIFRVVLSVALAIAVAIAAVAFWYAAATAIAAVIASGAAVSIGIGVIAVATISGGLVGYTIYNLDCWGDNMPLPMYTCTPEEIFKGNIGLFNVNFFNPEIEVKDTEETVAPKTTILKTANGTINYGLLGQVNEQMDDIYNALEEFEGPSFSELASSENQQSTSTADSTTTVYSFTSKDKTFTLTYTTNNTNINSYNLVIEGPPTDEGYRTGKTNIAEELQPTISRWYQILRTIALVGMLSVLVYIGIRIVISSSAENKAKYKQNLMDWLVGICLLFVMHYFMVFMNLVVDKVTDVLTSIDITTSSSSAAVDGVEINDKIEKILTDDLGLTINEDNGSNEGIIKTVDEDRKNIYNMAYKPNGKTKNVSILWKKRKCRLLGICGHVFSNGNTYYNVYLYIPKKGFIYGIFNNDSSIYGTYISAR